LLTLSIYAPFLFKEKQDLPGQIRGGF